MKEIYIKIFLFVVVIVYHEIGHAISIYWYTNKFPKFTFNWWGIVAGEKESMNLTMRELAITAMWGIVFGYFVLLVFDFDRVWILFYIIMSAIDIFLVWQYFNKEMIGLRDVQIKYLKTIDMRKWCRR